MSRQRTLVVTGMALVLAACAGTSPKDRRAEVVECPPMPAVVPLSIPVAGETIAGRLYLPEAGGRRATLAWFHGFPGLPEPSPAVVSAVTAAGMNLLYVHYRGTWGNAGQFGAANAVEDARAALAFLREPTAAHACRVAPEAVVAVGDSLGSWVALQAAAMDDTVACVAGALVVDLGTLGRMAAEDAGVRAGFTDMFAAVDADPELGFTLRGGAAGLMDELVRSQSANALAPLADRLRHRPVLLIGAEADQLAPPALHLAPFAKALTGASAVTTRLFPGGHELLDADYVGFLLDWIRQDCPAAARVRAGDAASQNQRSSQRSQQGQKQPVAARPTRDQPLLFPMAMR